jgi:hypothetical protein
MSHAGWFGADGTFLTDEGFRQFKILGIDLEHKTKRKICCGCLDWSERRFHLGGEAGAQFLRCANTNIGYKKLRVFVRSI